MKLLIVNNAEADDRSFNDPLIKAVSDTGAGYEIVSYEDIPSVNTIRQFGAVILSGVRKSAPVSTIEDRRKRLEPVLSSLVTVVGICVIHQAIGKDKGGRIKVQGEEEEGPIEARLVQAVPHPFFNGIARKSKVQTMHTCSVTLPEGFILEATSDTCENQAMSSADGSIVTTQFHPELSRDCGRYFANIVEMASRRGELQAA